MTKKQTYWFISVIILFVIFIFVFPQVLKILGNSKNYQNNPSMQKNDENEKNLIEGNKKEKNDNKNQLESEELIEIKDDEQVPPNLPEFKEDSQINQNRGSYDDMKDAYSRDII